MARHRVTFEFESATGASATSGSKAGWTESWYQNNNYSDTDATLAGATLATYRQRLLTPGWQLPAMRVSQLDDNTNLIRRGQLVFFSPAVSPGTYPGANQDEQPYDGLVMSISTIDGHFRHTHFRGIGNNVVNAGGRFLNPAAFAAGLNDFRTVLTGNIAFVGDHVADWALRVRSNQWLRYIVIDVTLGGIVGVLASPIAPAIRTDLLTNVAAGQTVTISRAGGMQNLNGSWQVDGTVVDVTGASWIRLRPKRRITVTGTYAIRSGYASGYTYLLNDIVSIFGEYGSSRRTGRPTQLVRGRRSNRTS